MPKGNDAQSNSMDAEATDETSAKQETSQVLNDDAGSNDGQGQTDDVTILVGDKVGQGGKIALFIQIDSTQENVARVAFNAIAENLSKSLRECIKKKFTAIYMITLAVGLACLAHVVTDSVITGTPTTVNSSEAVLRLQISVACTIIISIGAYFMLTLGVSSVAVGLLWMFFIVSLLYFLTTALTKAGYDIHFIDHTKLNDAFLSVYVFTSIFYNSSSETGKKKNLPFLQRFAHNEGCCDFKCEKCPTPNMSFWQQILLSVNSPDKWNVPEYSCEIGQKDKSKGTRGFCVINDTYVQQKFKGTKYFCSIEKLLQLIRTQMVIVLFYSTVMTILCLGMAYVFWYYYSDMKAQELSSTEPLGDFALLNLARPHLADQKVEDTTRDKMRKLRRHRRMQHLKEKFGIDLNQVHHHHHHHPPGGQVPVVSGGQQPKKVTEEIDPVSGDGDVKSQDPGSKDGSKKGDKKHTSKSQRSSTRKNSKEGRSSKGNSGRRTKKPRRKKDRVQPEKSDKRRSNSTASSKSSVKKRRKK